MKKQFKAESKKLMDLMINSIYTNKDIFLRELISNASDAIDKISYQSLTDKTIKLDKPEIHISLDKDKKTITISDNGCGMDKDSLETNLGTIAQSDSEIFKQNVKDKTNIIGQFGVGFYSTFMVAKEVDVISKPYNSAKAYVWVSKGIDGYTIEETNKDSSGTTIVITLKDDIDDYKYSEYLDEYKIKELIHKYSNYIRYPIMMEVTKSIPKKDNKDEHEDIKDIETLNEMTPIWKKDKKKVNQEDYDNFYMDKFSDYEKPLKVIKYDVEGLCSFSALLFIPSHAPFEYYSNKYEKGLKLYSNGVLIMDNCSDLLPDYYGFVKGVVDSVDLSLNISREMLQQDKQVKLIAKSITKKIDTELKDMLENDLENYKKFYKEFGTALKMGIYNSYGMNKDELEDLLLFYSSKDKDLITLKDYISRLVDKQDSIYYAVGESVDKIDLLPQVESIKSKGYEILYLSDYADEFVVQVLGNYSDKKFVNVESSNLDIDSEEDKKELDKINNDSKDMLDAITKALNGKISKTIFTNNLEKHPVCLTTNGSISTSMEKVINAMPITNEKVSADKVLVINAKHPIVDKLRSIYKDNPKEIDKYAEVLYAEARLIEGLNIENPNEISDIICNLLSK